MSCWQSSNTTLVSAAQLHHTSPHTVMGTLVSSLCAVCVLRGVCNRCCGLGSFCRVLSARAHVTRPEPVTAASCHRWLPCHQRGSGSGLDDVIGATLSLLTCARCGICAYVYQTVWRNSIRTWRGCGDTFDSIHHSRHVTRVLLVC